MDVEKIKSWIKQSPDYPTIESFSTKVLGISRENFYTKMKNETFRIQDVETILKALGKTFHELYDEDVATLKHNEEIQKWKDKYYEMLEEHLKIVKSQTRSELVGKLKATNEKDQTVMPTSA